MHTSSLAYDMFFLVDWISLTMMIIRLSSYSCPFPCYEFILLRFYDFHEATYQKKTLSWGFRMLEMYCCMEYSHFLVYILYLLNVESIVKFWSVATFYTFMKGPHLVGKYVLIMVFVNKVPMLVLISESLVLWRLWSLKLPRTEKSILKHKKSWTHLSEMNKCSFYWNIANEMIWLLSLLQRP